MKFTKRTFKSSLVMILFIQTSLTLMGQNSNKQRYIYTTYTGNGLTPSLIQVIKLQEKDPAAQEAAMSSIGNYKYFYTLIYDRQTRQSFYLLDSIQKINGIHPSGNSFFVLSEGNKMRGKEIFTNNRFYFEIPKEKLKWQITKEEKKIGKYNCQKAILTNLKSTVVWFTKSVPIPIGPDIYQSLPGLVVNVETVVDNINLTSLSFKDQIDNHHKSMINASNNDFSKAKKKITEKEVFSSKNNFIEMISNELKTGHK